MAEYADEFDDVSRALRTLGLIQRYGEVLGIEVSADVDIGSLLQAMEAGEQPDLNTIASGDTSVTIQESDDTSAPADPEDVINYALSRDVDLLELIQEAAQETERRPSRHRRRQRFPMTSTGRSSSRASSTRTKHWKRSAPSNHGSQTRLRTARHRLRPVSGGHRDLPLLRQSGGSASRERDGARGTPARGDVRHHDRSNRPRAGTRAREVGRS